MTFPAESACTTEGQFNVAAYMAANESKAFAETVLRARNNLIETTHARRVAKAAPHAAARARALEDGRTLKGPLASVFGMPIGSASSFPECAALGGYHLERGGILAGTQRVVLDDPPNDQTCIRISDDGLPSVSWPTAPFPAG